MLSNIRRRIGVLTAVAVLAALVPTLATSPVSAAPATTAIIATTLDAPASYLACPTSAAIPSAGFTDTTDTAVDCIKYYGITEGTTATEYSPTDSVTRWQMALYLTRLLDVANVALGTGADQGFTDISGKSDAIQLAINQLKQLGITEGKTATTYAPDDNVLRQEMALFIERTLDNLPAGPGGSSESDGAGTTDAGITYINGECGVDAGVKTCSGLYNYTDVDSGSITVDASIAIKELFTLGIHDGVAATTFNPSSDMTRAAMATFLNAAMNHSNIRPEGLHLQSDAYTNVGSHTPNMSVSYRDASFDPIASAPVDVHYWTNTTTAEQQNLTSAGACNTAYTSATADSITECYMDTSETTTDATGNMSPTANATAPVSTIYAGTDTYHAWTAAIGTTFDNDLHGEATLPNKYSSIDVVANPAAAALRCAMDTPAYTGVNVAAHTMKFGATTTVTCTVVNNTSGATTAAVPVALAKVQFDRTQTFTTDSTGVQTNEVLVSSSEFGYTDADGVVSFSVTGPADTLGVDVVTDALQITMISTAAAAITDEYAYNTVASTSGHFADGGVDLQATLVYTDTDAAINSVTLTQTSDAAAYSTAGVTRSVTASSWDQYGDAISGQTVTFTDRRTLPDALGVICSAATPTICTSITAHGLAVGDDLSYGSMGANDVHCVSETGNVLQAVNSVVVVATVPSGTTFTIDDASGNDIGCSIISTAAAPTQFYSTSFDNGANNTRTSSATGTASFSWIDTEGTGGKDTVTATSGAKTASKVYYALDTAASFAEEGLGAGTLSDDDVVGRIETFDATNDFMIAEITCAGGTPCASHANTQTLVKYYKYTWDSNDHFSNAGANATPTGTAVTQAAWELTGAALASANAGAGRLDDLYIVDWSATAAGVSRFHTN